MPVVIPEKNAIVVKARDPRTITDIIHTNQVIDDHYVAVPHTIDALKILKNLGVEVTGLEPIQFMYQWTKLFGTYEPMDHQRLTAAFLTFHKRCFVFNQQRTGKTASVLWAVDYLRKSGQLTGGILVLSTLSTMRSVWEQETFGVNPEMTVGVAYHTSRKRREAILDQDHAVYVLNHDGIKVVHKKLQAMIASGRITGIVVDEGAEFADHTTAKWRVLKTLTDKVDILWWLTATPISRGVDKVWAQAKLVGTTKIPYTYSDWRARVMFKVNKFKWVPLQGAEEKCYEVLQPAIRIRKRDVLKDLPPLVHQYLDIPLSKEQDRLLKQLKRDGAMLTKDGDLITAANAAVEVGKVIQICAGAVRTNDEDAEAVEINCQPKFDAMCGLIENTEAKTIVFASHHATIDWLKRCLLERYGDTAVVHVDGRIKGNKRELAFEAFKRTSECHILLAHPATVSHGLEFSVADTTIWFSPFSSPEKVAQANERMASAAQKNPMAIYYLASHFIERAAYQSVRDGLSLQERALAFFNQWMES